MAPLLHAPELGAPSSRALPVEESPLGRQITGSPAIDLYGPYCTVTYMCTSRR